jgi:putative hemolysin
MTLWQNAIVLACGLTFSFLWSGWEMGAYAVNRIRLRYRAAGLDEPRSRRLEVLFARMPQFVATVLVANSVANYAVANASTSIVMALLPEYGPELLVTVVVAPLLFLFTELAPKVVFRLRADTLMPASAYVLSAAAWVLSPLARSLAGIGYAARAALGLPEQQYWAVVSRKAVHSHMAAGADQGMLSAPQHRLAENTLRSGSSPAATAGTPIEASILLSVDATAGDLVARAGDLRTPRALIYSGPREHVVGVVHIVTAWSAPRQTPLSELMTAPVWLDERWSVLQALVALSRADQSVGILASPAPAMTAPSPSGITQSIEWHARGLVTVEGLFAHLVDPQRPA